MQTTHGGDQPAVKHAARAQQRREFLPAARELLEVDDEEQRLGADERGDDDPDAEVEHLVGVEPGLPGAARRHPQPEQIGRGQQHAVRVDGDRSELKQDWMHGVPAPEGRKSSRRRQSMMAASATLKAQKCQPRHDASTIVEHVAGGGAIDQVADRAAENAWRRPAARADRSPARTRRTRRRRPAPASPPASARSSCPETPSR